MARSAQRCSYRSQSWRAHVLYTTDRSITYRAVQLTMIYTINACMLIQILVLSSKFCTYCQTCNMFRSMLIILIALLTCTRALHHRSINHVSCSAVNCDIYAQCMCTYSNLYRQSGDTFRPTLIISIIIKGPINFKARLEVQ